MFFARPLGFLVALLLVADGLYADSKQPNVLLLITDEHNFRTLGCYREVMPREQAEMWGREAVVPTPNFDRLANQGVLWMCSFLYSQRPIHQTTMLCHNLES